MRAALADADEKGPHPVRLGQVDALIESIDRFSAAIRVLPAGARRSPLATAALYDELHQAHGDLGSEVRFDTKAHVVGAGE